MRHNVFIRSLVKQSNLGLRNGLDKEQLGNSKPFPVTNMPVHLLNR